MIRFINKYAPFLKRHRIISLALKMGLLKSVQEITFNESARIYVDLMDPEPRNAFIRNEFEPDFFDVASQFIKPDSHILDVGSNVGFCSFGLAAMFSFPLNFHLFEANANLCSLLEKSKLLYPHHNFYINNACVSNSIGSSTFTVSKTQSGQSHVSENTNSQEHTYEVQNIVIDAYAQEKQIQKIDFLKMDIEGYELFALQGLQNVLKNQNVSSLYIECINKNFNRYQYSVNTIFDYLSKYDFVPFFCKSDDFISESFSKRMLKKLEIEPVPKDLDTSHLKTDILFLPKVNFGND